MLKEVFCDITRSEQRIITICAKGIIGFASFNSMQGTHGKAKRSKPFLSEDYY